jgi:hypothetical protein
MLSLRLIFILIISLGTHMAAYAARFDNNTIPVAQYLPDPFTVYVHAHQVSAMPVRGWKAVDLPTDNREKINPGCYIACYSHHKGIYAIAEKVYVHGLVRLSGSYQGKKCQPRIAHGQDISQMPLMRERCQIAFASCRDPQTGDARCWAGGDTGGWFLQ